MTKLSALSHEGPSYLSPRTLLALTKVAPAYHATITVYPSPVWSIAEDGSGPLVLASIFTDGRDQSALWDHAERLLGEAS